MCNNDPSALGRDVFHALARHVLDPLEFKEVKMLAVEILTKLPVRSVAPFVFTQLLGLVREESAMLAASSATEALYAPVLDGLTTLPDTCGIVVAKLMVYYLNRTINENAEVAHDVTLVPFIVTVLLQVLSIPCDAINTGGARSQPQNLLADLQMGCMDSIALLILRDLSAQQRRQSKVAERSLLDLLLDWIVRGDASTASNLMDNTSDSDGGDGDARELSELAFAVEMMVLALVSSASHTKSSSGLRLPLQVRICCCNILLRYVLTVLAAASG